MDQLAQLPIFQGFVIYLKPKDLSNLILTNRKFVRLTENKGVMKEYRQKYQEVILEASFPNDKFEGRIRTCNHLIEYYYEVSQNCCEDFEVCSYPDELSLVGRSLKFDQIDLVENGNCIIDFTGNNFAYSYSLILPLDGKEVVTITFFNSHNGYCAHNLNVKIDGQYKWNVAI